jgi:hypothetical protein
LSVSRSATRSDTNKKLNKYIKISAPAEEGHKPNMASLLPPDMVDSHKVSETPVDEVLSYLYRDKEMADIHLVSNDNTRFNCYACILVSRCSYFRIMLRTQIGTHQKLSKEHLPEVLWEYSGIVVQTLHDYIYTGSAARVDGLCVSEASQSNAE